MRTPLYVDVLTDLLQRSRARGAAFSSTTARGAWGLTFPGSAPLSVHALVEGEAHLWSIDPKDALHVFPGDVVLVREHTPHHLASRAGARCVPLVEAMATVTGVGRRLAVGDPGEPVAATFFCGAYRFEGDLCESLLQALPDTLHLRPAAGSTLRATMDLLAGEMLRDDPGQQALLDRLLDVALVQILREHFSTTAATAPGWFRASGDARIAPALQALHSNPGPAVDGCRAGRARPPLAFGVRAPIHGAVGGSAAHLPQRLADGPGPRTAARLRRAAGLDRRRARLRVGVLVCGSLQAPPRHCPGTLAPRGAPITT